MCAIISGLKTFRSHAGPTQKFALLPLTFRVLKFGPYMVCKHKAIILFYTKISTSKTTVVLVPHFSLANQ
jgi:hypothetical protein